MSSVSRINGLRPVKSITGAPYSGGANVYYSDDATVIMVGDAVKLAGDARAASGVATVTRSAATDLSLGVVVGILFSGMGDVTNMPPVNNLNTPIFKAANQGRYLLVADDPNLVYEVQYQATSASAATITALVGLNGNFLANAGDTNTGTSGFQLATAGTAVTSTLPLKIVGFPNRPDNIPGDTYFNFWVKLNTPTYGGLGTAGV